MALTSRKFAMVVAVSDYDSEHLRQLEFCKNDGAEMNKVLKNIGYEIKPNNLMVGKVDGHSLNDGIIEFFEDNEIKALDTVLFYFSGHGIPDTDDTFLSSTNIDVSKPRLRGFSFNDLMKEVSKCVSQKIILVLDCCYSGSASLGKGTDDGVVLGTKAITKGSSSIQAFGRCILAASQSYEEAFAAQEGGNSLFTRHILDGLKGKEGSVNVNGNVTPETLGNYVFIHVTEENPNQKPIIKVESGGEIILASYPDLVDPEFDLSKITDVETLIADGKKSMLTDEFDKSRRYFSRALEIDPNNSKIWRNLGRLREKCGDRTGAIECFNEAIQKRSTDSISWFNKGTIFLKDGNYNAALECFEQAIKNDPSDDDSWHNMAVAYFKLNKHRDARRCLSKENKIEKEKRSSNKEKKNFLKIQNKN